MQDISPKQRQSLIESNGKINIWEGAVRSGKTYISIWRFIKELTYGKEGEYAIICRTYDSFVRNILRQFVDKIGGDARHYSGKRQLHVWGKTVHIIGADDERAEAKIRGPTFQGAYVDEATIIPESVFKMLVSRCAMNDAKIFATTNPDSPFHWLKVDFLTDNSDVKSWQFRLDDNPQLSLDDKQYLRRQYRGLWYQRFIEGLWVQAEGSIYDFFDEKVHILNPQYFNATHYIVGVDYGTTNPCSFVLVGVNEYSYPNYWVEEEYYYDSKIHQRQKTDAEYAEDFLKFIKGKPIKGVYIDPAAASFKAELQRSGVQNLYDAKNEVIDGIRFVSTLLNAGSLKIVRNCKNLIKEFQSYVWDAKAAIRGEEKPLKQNDHALDALRYALFSGLFNKKSGGITAEDIDKMHREVMGKGPELPPIFQDQQNPYIF